MLLLIKLLATDAEHDIQCEHLTESTLTGGQMVSQE
jgi:hypothetical protein